MAEPVGVLYVIDELLRLGGAERNLLRIVDNLPRERYRPSVLSFHLNRNVKQFLTMSCPLEIWPVYNLHSAATVRHGWRLYRKLRRERIGLVHTTFETADLWAGPLARLAGARLVSSRRDMGLQRNWKLNLAYRLAGGMFDQVQCVSDQVRGYVIEQDRMPPERVITVPNSIEMDNLPPRQRRDDGRPVIVTLANTRHVKGIDVLIAAAERVCRRHGGALFLIAGCVMEPEYDAAMRARVKELGLDGNVQFLGQREDPLELLSGADVFFLPSRSEGMSNALLEAMASGLPPVATSVGGNIQLMRDGVNGFLVESEDDEAAAERICRLLEDPALAAELGSNARRMAGERYSVGAAMELLMGEYEKLLRRPQKP